MLPYISHLSWKLGPLTIQSFGVLFSIAVMVTVFLALRQLKAKQEKEHGYNIALLAVIGGLIGARLLHVLQFWDFYSENIFTIINLLSGGLTWYGGLIGGFLAATVYIKIKGLDFWKLADIIAPALTAGQAVGRIGCILGDGGHVGTLTNVAWGFNVNGEVRHVTAWYSLINLGILYFILTKLRKRNPFSGFLFLFYLVYYSATRFLIDILRTDPRYFGFTLTQYLCIVIFIISSVLLFVRWRSKTGKPKGKRKKAKKRNSEMQTPDICPNCKSKNITLYMGGIFGKYKCKKCGYLGPLIVEEKKA